MNAGWEYHCNVAVRLGRGPVYLFTHMQNDEIVELSGRITLNDMLRFYYFQVLRKTWWFWALIASFTIVLITTAVVFTILSYRFEVAKASLPLILACCFFGNYLALPLSGSSEPA